MEECPNDKSLIKYIIYLVNNYISDDRFFNPELWACNSASIQLMTNPYESFHLYFDKTFYCDSPFILSWLNIIWNGIQIETYIKMDSVHIIKSTKDRKVKKRQHDNQARILQYISVKTTRYKFVISMCCN